MASKVAALVFLNLLFFVCVSSHKTPPCAPTTPTPVKPTPKTPSPMKPAKCPINTLKLGVCANLLGGLVNLVLGESSKPCCTLLGGLADLDAALCLCTAIKANVLGIVKLDVPVAVSLLVNACGLKTPKGFKC